MKTTFILRLIATIVGLFIGTKVFAQEQAITIHIEKAGTLSSYIADSKRDVISNLKLSGELNGTDIIYLRKMKNLTILDLSDVTIVSGGYNYITYSNRISSFMFDNCEQLTQITIPNSVNEIESGGLSCKKLKTIIANEQNQSFSSVDGILFNKNQTELVSVPADINISSYKLPERVLKIYGYAFYRCSQLETIDIHHNVTEIGYLAFAGCKELKSVYIPVTKIGGGVFRNCKKLSSVTLSSGLTVLSGSTMFSNTALQSIIIPESVEVIEKSVFSGADNLSHITFPSTIKTIKSPSSLRQFKEVRSYAQIPPEWDASGEPDDDAVLYIPKGSYDAYWLAKSWGDFKTIIEMDYDPTANEEIQPEQNINILSSKGNIRIEANEPTNIFVYTINGQMILNKSICGNENIQLPQGFYIVKAGNQTQKVMVK